MANDLRPRTPANPKWRENPDALDWYNSRPQIIKDLIDKYPPEYYYEIEGHPYYYIIVSYSEDGTLTVYTDGIFPPITSREVFGVSPNNLKKVEPLNNERKE